MMDTAGKAWLGAAYLRDEGGYKEVLGALDHYEKRLRSIGKSPELEGAAAMFGSVLHQQARKTMPEIASVRDKMIEWLADPQGKIVTSEMAKDVPFMEKALLCHKADMQKALDTGHEYFVNLIGGTGSAEKDIVRIEAACKRIREFE